MQVVVQGQQSQFQFQQNLFNADIRIKSEN